MLNICILQRILALSGAKSPTPSIVKCTPGHIFVLGILEARHITQYAFKKGSNEKAGWKVWLRKHKKVEQALWA